MAQYEDGIYEASPVGIRLVQGTGEDPPVEITFRLKDSTDTVHMKQYTSEAAWPYTLANLKRIGFGGDFANPTWNDAVIQIEASTEEFNGKLSTKWNFPRQQAKAASSDLVAKLSARFRQAAGPTMTKIPPAAPAPAQRPSATPPAPKAPAAAPAATPPPGDDDGDLIQPTAPLATKEAAWALWVEKQKGDTVTWTNTIRELRAKYSTPEKPFKEANFESKHWAEVMAIAQLPF